MSRVSQEELYNDKDVVTQILKLKDTVNDYAGGIIENIDVSGNDLVIDWADGTNISLPLPPPTGISSVAGAVSGGNLTITFYMTDGSSHAFTCPLTGMASITYVDGLDAQNVKKTGSIVTGALEVPTTPLTPTSAINDVYANNATEGVNNILHKSGVETRSSILKFLGNTIRFPITPKVNERPTSTIRNRIFWEDEDLTSFGNTGVMIRDSGVREFRTEITGENGAVTTLLVYSSNTGTVDNPNMQQYATLSHVRVTSAGQVSGNTTYNTDIVTVGMLKALGLIS